MRIWLHGELFVTLWIHTDAMEQDVVAFEHAVDIPTVSTVMT